MTTTAIYDELLAACGRGSPVAAIRLTSTYEPTGGPTSKVFPPTYPDVGYLFEERYINGVKTPVAALDSVPSQANRLEDALLDAVEAGEIRLPYIEVAAELEVGSFRVTSLDAPHRSPDAYFRDSQTADGTPFDKSPLGLRLRRADERNARAFFEHSPTDLVLGMWDSQRGGRGLRLPRAYTSEIIALEPEKGTRVAGRLDPYNMTGGEVHYDKSDKSNWSFDAKQVTGATKLSKGKPSSVLHGNAFGDALGGVAVSGITRTAVLSLAVLHRLRFPVDGHVADPAVDAAGRAALAALALLGDRLAFAHAGVFLRSGCDLVTLSESAEWVRGGGVVAPLECDVTAALELYRTAVDRASALGLGFAAEPVRLEPAPNLRELIELNLSRPASTEDD